MKVKATKLETSFGEIEIDEETGTITVNGNLYVPQNTEISKESQTVEGLELKMWKELDALFDEHSTETGRDPICYQRAVEYLVNIIDADAIKLSFLKNTSDLGILPEEFKLVHPSLEDVVVIRPGSEEYYRNLEEQNLLFNIITGTPTEGLIQNQVTQKYEGTYQCQTKEDVNAVAILELYGVPSNDQKTKAAIETFEDIIDTKIHADLTNYKNILRILAKSQQKEFELLQSIQEQTGTQVKVGKEKEIKITPQIQKVVMDEKGFYYKDGSFFDKNHIFFNRILGELKFIAIEYFNLPDVSKIYNNTQSDKFINEVELTDKLAKLNIATTYFETLGKPALQGNLGPTELEELYKSKDIQDIAMGNALIGLYSLLPKRLRKKDGKPVFSTLQEEYDRAMSFSKLKISKALNTLFFDEKTNKNPFFRPIQDNQGIRFEVHSKQNVFHENYAGVLTHIHQTLPYINDIPEKNPTRQNASANMREAIDIFMGITQRTPYHIVLPGYEKEADRPHTVLEGLQFLNKIGYAREAGIIAHAVYYPYPFKKVA